MSSACDKCAKPVKADEESVTCMGFCDRMIHLKCSGSNPKLNKNLVNVLLTSPNLFWMCDECVKLMKCARFKTTVLSFGDAINSITQSQELAHAELRKEIGKQGELIARLSRGIVHSTPIHPGSGGRLRQPPLKRPRTDGLLPSKPLAVGTKVVTNNDIVTEVITVPEPAAMFWLYLSRIHPSVKPESIEKLVKDCIQCEDSVKVVPLVKKGIDIKSMSFISFKVGIDPKFRDVALNANTWPMGLLFREFEDISSKNMWKPLLNTPTVTVSPVGGIFPLSTPTSAPEPMS